MSIDRVPFDTEAPPIDWPRPTLQANKGKTVTTKATSRTAARYLGTFEIAPGHKVGGELIIAGQQSRLKLQSNEQFPTDQIPDRCITGVLDDLTKVSLLGCVIPRVCGHSSGPRGTYYFAKVIPQYVIHGDEVIHPSDAVVLKAMLFLDDATTLFFDFDAFGTVPFDAELLIKQIIEQEPSRKNHKTGPDARIVYYTGCREIVSADSSIGQVLVERTPSFGGGTRRVGGFLRDEVAVSLCFEDPLVFDEALRRVQRIIDYVGLLVGRPQNLEHLRIETTSHELLRVDWVMYEMRARQLLSGKPNSFDVLINGATEADKFASVTTNWLERHESWHESRWRFFDSFSQQQFYDINRLIASANMFDVLPQAAVPQDNPMAKDVLDAQRISDKAFRSLPKDRPERQSTLSFLGRLNKATLKQKIRHRGQPVLDRGNDAFTDLFKITDEAVNCRNFYVHGSEGGFDYGENFDMVIFFTQTLEFVFAASDLIEAGWDLESWIQRGTTGDHPFGRYRISYHQNLNRLLSLLR